MNFLAESRTAVLELVWTGTDCSAWRVQRENFILPLPLQVSQGVSKGQSPLPSPTTIHRGLLFLPCWLKTSFRKFPAL